MRRTMAPVMVLALVLAFLCACGHNEEAKRAQEQLKAANKKIADNTVELNKLKAKLDGLKTLDENNESMVQKSLQDIQENLKKVSDSNDEVEASLTHSLTPPPSTDGKSAGSWSWPIRIVLILVVVVGLFYFYKRLTREDESEDELDTEFQEENDLGTVRYPGTPTPAAPEPKPAKPAE